MKTRESGMPDESSWSGFLAPEVALEKLGLEPDSGDVVDFGCGYGTFAIPAAKIVRGSVHALDIEKKMVAATKAKAEAEDLRNVRVHRRDFVAEGTGLPDSSVGYATLFNILHCEQPLVLLKEAWRVLVPGGTLAVMHWNYDPATPRGPSMSIRPRPEQCRAWAIEAGFEPIGAERIELPPYHYGMTFRKAAPDPRQLPLLNHPLHAPTVFRPEELVQAVRDQRQPEATDIPEICVLDFDGDLTDALVNAHEVQACEAWSCFHTSMWSLTIDGQRYGIIARTIGGPYTVLVAEQLAVCGVRIIVGLTSAGRIGLRLPVPGVVVVERAIRDEGTSYHYLPASESVEAPAGVADALEAEVSAIGLPVQRGLVWTTDAPYRETAEQIDRYARMGALAVEMQAASLFAFAAARGVAVGMVAHVTNAPDYDGERFDKGSHELQRDLLHAVCRGARRFLNQSVVTG
jgi:uridine phosphorylase/ubiquinone/menaquinone biosynthesis C-methylase UbiE